MPATKGDIVIFALWGLFFVILWWRSSSLQDAAVAGFCGN
jgi:hypothetical protein